MGFSSVKVRRRFPTGAKIFEMPRLGTRRHCKEESCGKCNATVYKKFDCKSEKQICIPYSRSKFKLVFPL